jgi:hypothetical protein
MLPIDHAQALGLLAAVLAVRHGHRDAFLEQPIDLAVGRLQAHRRAVAGQLVDGVVDGLRRQLRIEPDQSGAQAADQHHLALGFASQRAARTEALPPAPTPSASRVRQTDRWRVARRVGLRCRRGRSWHPLGWAEARCIERVCDASNAAKSNGCGSPLSSPAISDWRKAMQLRERSVLDHRGSHAWPASASNGFRSRGQAPAPIPLPAVRGTWSS